MSGCVDQRRKKSDMDILIKKLANIPAAVFLKQRRKGWKSVDLIRWASRMIALLLRCMVGRRQYNTDKLSGARQRMEQEMGNPSLPVIRSSLRADLYLALSTQPRYRDAKCIKRILWLLRATKAFKHLFPADMETEVAKYVSYEKYDDGRIVAHQGRPPERFYYVISGRMCFLRQFKLSSGPVTKETGYLSKGKTSDPEEMEKQWFRENLLVTKGNVEVLLLEKKAFDHLSNATAGPPLDFLNSLDLFQEFPVDVFTSHSDAIEIKYYSQGKIIIQDSNRTPWLHIIKTGQVKILRKQPVIDARLSNESKFTSPRIESLGCGKSSSHADAMLGVQAKQRKWKGQKVLPRIKDKEVTRAAPNPFSKSLGVTPQEVSASSPAAPMRGQSVPEEGAGRASARSVHTDGQIENLGRHDVTESADLQLLHPPAVADDESHSVATVATATTATPSAMAGLLPGMKRPKPMGLAPSESSKAPTLATIQSLAVKMDTPTPSASKTRVKRLRRARGNTFKLNIPMKTDEEDDDDEFAPHAFWMTRERTLAPRKQKALPLRHTYVQLGLLNPGDIFGLDHLHPALASEPQGVSLLSNGAEVIKISKRFFLAYAGNNTMLKVETMYNDYIGEDEAKEVLYNKETWNQYRTAIWERMTANRPMVSGHR